MNNDNFSAQQAIKEALEIKIGDEVHPKITAVLWLADVPINGEYLQQRKVVCVFEGVGTIIDVHKVLIDFDKWNNEAAKVGVKLGIAGLVPYTSYLIRCESGEGWTGHGAVIKSVKNTNS